MHVYIQPMTKYFRTKDFKKITVYTILYLITTGIIFSVFTLTPHESYNFTVLRKFIILFASVLLKKYFFYLLLSPWHDVLVSIMIPAWNEEIGVLHTLDSIAKGYYRNIEIIIINDGSTDNSDALIREYIQKNEIKNSTKSHKIPIIYKYKKNGGKGAALNSAIKLSKGEILISIDADCLLLRNTIKNFVRCFANSNVMAAVGNVKVSNTKTLIGVVQHLEFLFSFYFKKADSVMNTIYIIGGAAGAFRRSTIKKVGHYNTNNITEDIELSVRIQQAGMKIVYASDAIVYTEGASDLDGLIKQRLRWKRGRFETFFEHKSIFFSFKKKHNKVLSWIVLPLAYFGELQLSLELFFIAFLYFYSFMINDFSSFISGIIVVASMFFVQIAFDSKEYKNASFYFLMPIGWLLFYLTTFVELNALVKSLWGLFKKKELKWQKWERRGLHG